MTFLGVVGILLGLIAIRFAYIEQSRTRLAVFVVAYLFHLMATFAYYSFSLNNITDASGYYLDYFNDYEEQGIGIGTLFVTYIVQAMKRALGGTFLDFFLMFQAISFFAICLLMRTIEEIYREIGVEQPPYAYFLPLLPGLHFWTSAIGKDGALLLAVCLAIWSARHLATRYPAMLGGLAIMVAIRPHIAMLAVAALACTFLFETRSRLFVRILLVAVSLAGLALTLSSVEQMSAVDVTDADSVSDFLAAHEQVTQDAEVAGNSAVYGSFAFKLLSLLFRPMFIDAEDIMGLAASSENFILLLLVGTIFARLRTVVMLARRLAYVRFTVVFGALVAALLALVYYNIGLGLRQKTMFVPAIIVVFVTLMALGRARALLPLRSAAATPPKPAGEATSVGR